MPASGQMKDQLPYRSGPNKPVVGHLTHMNRHVPVTLLATYSDGLCDLEVTELFIQKWAKQQHRRFAFPGTLHSTGEPGSERFILRQVPQALLSAEA
ncbi:unnamed protein product [Effrenium voratum]|uniref:Uncharacterized protein n=1 Tax=Effrenium voratum TaxID=2562239 RepID=A0AA36J6S7_9DINO|nr:unnamed protein product [Effrenium voratum]